MPCSGRSERAPSTPTIRWGGNASRACVPTTCQRQTRSCMPYRLPGAHSRERASCSATPCPTSRSPQPWLSPPPITTAMFSRKASTPCPSGRASPEADRLDGITGWLPERLRRGCRWRTRRSIASRHSITTPGSG
ncbi:MAG: hypothetical protein IKT00_00755 [Prevotella sp.]|nr:hypothetical protein [Prevotella sp.]